MEQTWSVSGGPHGVVNVCPESFVGGDGGVELRGDAGEGGQGGAV